MSQSVEVLKRKGKTESQIWTYLSNIEKPYKLKEVQCVHCGEIVKTWQKVDRAESHLKKCQEFKRKHAVNSGDRPLFLDEKRAKIGDKSTKPSRCSLYPLALLRQNETFHRRVLFTPKEEIA